MNFVKHLYSLVSGQNARIHTHIHTGLLRVM